MAACAKSLGGAVLFTAATDTYTDPDKADIMIRAISITGGSAAGAITLKEGSDGTVADASGGVVSQGYYGIGMPQFIEFPHDRPFLADKGLKLSAITAAAIVVVYLA